jgi:hypothetical protein
VVHVVGQPEAQFGGHPARAVSAEGLRMDLGNEVSQLAIGEHPLSRVRMSMPLGKNADPDSFIVREHAATGRSAHRSTMKA